MEAYDLLGRTLTVSEASELIHSTVDELFYEMSIEGEVSGFRPASSGHWYFTLKDRGAAMDAAVFRSSQFSMVMPSDGDLVIAKGSLSYYTKTGRLTFIVREMKRKGEGDLLQQIEKRKEYYRALGYFDDERKKPIPEEISVLGVVTSPTGAAIRDILNITARRAPSLDIIIFPAAVQGEGAAENIAMRIRQADNFSACDLLIVGRGGGSMEDLSAFSEPAVIEAIHNCSIPVISAVGHEIDWPISDLAADRRAPTPSAAAEIATETIYRRRERLSGALLLSSSLIKSRITEAEKRLERAMHGLSELERKMLRYRGRIPSTADLRRILLLRTQNAETRLGYAMEEITSAMESRLRTAEEKLSSLISGSSAAMSSRAADAGTLITALQNEIRSTVGKRVELAKMRVKAAERECEALSPLQILKRGYSVTQRTDGSVVRSASDVKDGEELATRVMDGTIISIVKEGRNEL